MASHLLEPRYLNVATVVISGRDQEIVAHASIVSVLSIETVILAILAIPIAASGGARRSLETDLRPLVSSNRGILAL